MQDARVHGLDRRRQSGTAVGEHQLQLLAFQSPRVQIPEQPLPGRLTFALATQEGQQLAGTVQPHPVGH